MSYEMNTKTIHLSFNEEDYQEEEYQKDIGSISRLSIEDDSDHNKKWRRRREDHGLRVLVKPRWGQNYKSICMDIDEVKACRELGLELPCDWTVEIPSSPADKRRISSPGDNPRDVKARLKVWAQAVALASASSLGGLTAVTETTDLLNVGL